MFQFWIKQLTIPGAVLLIGVAVIFLPVATLAVDPVDTSSPGSFTPTNLPFDPSPGMEDRNMYGPELLDLGSTDPVTITYNIIVIVLSLLGTAFLVLLLYAGWLWLTARGNEEQITKAKKIIIQAVIGFVIIFMSLSLAQFIYGRFVRAGFFIS